MRDCKGRFVKGHAVLVDRDRVTGRFVNFPPRGRIHLNTMNCDTGVAIDLSRYDRVSKEVDLELKRLGYI